MGIGNIFAESVQEVLEAAESPIWFNQKIAGQLWSDVITPLTVVKDFIRSDQVEDMLIIGFPKKLRAEKSRRADLRKG